MLELKKRLLNDPIDSVSRQLLFIVLMMAGFGLSCDMIADELEADADSTLEASLEGSEDEDLEDLLNMDFEDLMDIKVVEVVSVAGTAESWFTTPAAMHVITNEDIRRSGAQTIADVLRTVPGMHVGQVSATGWAVAPRGSNGLFANKLQVVIDGRVPYEPLFAGVFWDIEDVMLEDVEQIEVIRGPGATLWGANAVNGVVNIKTKSAKDTQGLLLTAGYGTELPGFGSIRYGGTLGDEGHYRFWGKYRNVDRTVDSTGADRFDDWSLMNGGMRFDIHGDSDTEWTFIANGYNTPTRGGTFASPVPGTHFGSTVINTESRTSGGNLSAKAHRNVSETSWWTFQSYLDITRRADVGIELKRQTIDLDFRHSFQIGDRHTLLWGVGFNRNQDSFVPSVVTAFIPTERRLNTFSAFIQDTITLEENRWYLMVGSKFEHNDFTGFEWQPSARISYTPNEENSYWASVSRPIRRPARSNDDLLLVGAFADAGLLMGGPPAGIFVPLAILGDTDSQAENLLAWEGGWRTKIANNAVLDIAAFYNNFDDILSTPTGGVGTFNNFGSAEYYGVEVAVDWHPSENWAVEAWYSFIRAQVHGPVDAVTDENTTPIHQARISSSLGLTKDVEFNASLHYIDNMSGFDIGSHMRLDAGFTFQLAEDMELAIWGQNLLSPDHQEFFDPTFTDSLSQIERSVYAQLTVRF